MSKDIYYHLAFRTSHVVGFLLFWGWKQSRRWFKFIIPSILCAGISGDCCYDGLVFFSLIAPLSFPLSPFLILVTANTRMI